MKINLFNVLIFLIILFLFFSCNTFDNTDNNKIIEKDVEFEFVDFSFFINKENTIEDESGLYKVRYDTVFTFKNKNSKFLVNYKISDPDNNVLLEKNDVKPEEFTYNRNLFNIKDNFASYFSYDKILYDIEVIIGKEKKVFSGVYENELVPKIEEIKAGPVISQYNFDKKTVSLKIKVKLANCNELKWVRVIPPDKKSYWNIPYSKEDSYMIADGNIFDKKNSFIENGAYIVQINYGIMGMIQEDIQVVDIYGNKHGANYGFPIPSFIAEDKNNIRLEINSKKYIDYMDLVFYTKMGNNLNKIGEIKHLEPVEVLSKSDLKKSIVDQNDKHVKLKNNKEYYYSIYLYTKDYYGLTYISVSQSYKIKFKDFKFLPF